MMIPLRVLLIEDAEDDALLLLRELKRGGYQVFHQRVETAEDLKAAFQQNKWDIIISDYTLPQFSGIEALKLIEELDIDIPFLMVSGTIDEEMAVATMRAGAYDYLMKHNLQRLVPAVQRALREALVRLEHQQAEERLREQAALLDVAQDAIIVCDFKDVIHLWNQSAERLYGWTDQEALGCSAAELLFAEIPPEYAIIQQTVVETGEWQGEFYQTTKYKKSIIVESRWKILEDGLGKPKSILIVNTDITDKKQLEAQFLRAQRLESIGTLAGGIAHDLNNVLSPILMAVQILKMKCPAEPGIQKLLETVESSGKRGADIVKQVLTFARGIEGERGEIQVRYVIREICLMIRETFPKSIDLIADPAKNLWLISGDTTQLQQVILNLCVNARDAMPQGGKLTLKAENVWLDERDATLMPSAKSGPYILISVSDTGTGIPDDIVDKIFEPFFTTKPVGLGTGLGLSTTLGIIKSHGGFITLTTKEGEGTCFNIYLPAIATPNRQRMIGEQDDVPPGNGELVLVVDDEPAIRDISKRTLESYNYQVITAENGLEAIALYALHTTQIKAAVVDIRMPVMDGQATIQAIRRINPEVKIVAVSGVPVENQMMDSSRVEVQAFLTKPYTAPKLLRTLSNVLSQN